MAVKQAGEPLVLVFDSGTQSTRAFLFNKKGEIVCQERVDTKPFYSKRIGYAEKNTEDFWSALVQASLKLRESAGDLWNDVISVSMTSIRATYVFLDKDKQLLRPSITWLDQRQAQDKQRFGIFHRLIFALAGMSDVVKKQRRLSPATWMKENQPEIWERTEYFCLLSGYLNYKMSGRLCEVTACQASRLPYNYKKRRWMNKHELTYTVYNCEREKLVELVEPGDVFGYVTRAAASETGIPEGLPIVAVGSDKGCETLGVGALNENVAAISFGTAASVQVITDKYVEPQSFMPAYNACVPGKFSPEIQIFRGYWMVSWFKENFAPDIVEEAKSLGIKPETLLDMRLSEIPPGSDGLMVQPYWAPDLKIPEAKGTIIGFNDYHTRVHIYKAIIEGIGYGLYDGLRRLAKRTGNKIEKVSVSGGGAESDAVCQITADMFGIPVSRVQTYETSGLGAAITAFTYMGEFKDVDEAVKAMVRFKDTFYPKAANTKIYRKYYNEIYRGIYPRMQSLYERLYRLSNRHEFD